MDFYETAEQIIEREIEGYEPGDFEEFMMTYYDGMGGTPEEWAKVYISTRGMELQTKYEMELEKRDSTH